ncbi:hypothetical protein RJ640_020489 [Escallonia rubra]|uniref:Uncharacterized protein n=1 Tax=Escallonia rubra TaxID=112253 RepID=A0AA88UMM5_9ASTE|nr:hypothetical protein RJ640_020489 [Escallonia rubra]
MYNNAGIVDSPFANILHTNKSDLERVLGVNLVASLLGTKHTARVIVPRRQGSCKSSIYCVQAWNCGANEDPSSRVGIVWDNGQLCFDLKGKILKVKDAAMAALYLASDEASYVSGHKLVVDGGYSVVNPTMMKAAGLIP